MRWPGYVALAAAVAASSAGALALVLSFGSGRAGGRSPEFAVELNRRANALAAGGRHEEALGLLDRFERSFVPAAQTCTVNVLDANGNIIVRAGGYGNVDSRGKDSAVADPKTGLLRPRRPDDPADLKSPLTEPDPGLLLPQHLGVTDEAVYVVDGGNFRLVRILLGYAAEAAVPVP